jgi:glycosyltransferase involved in cell wall biosynthesis
MSHPNDHSNNSRANAQRDDATEQLVAEITAGIANRQSRRRKKRHQAPVPGSMPVEARRESNIQKVDFTPAPAAPVTPPTAPVAPAAPVTPAPVAVKPAVVEPARVEAPVKRPMVVETVPKTAAGASILAVFCFDEPNGSIASYLANYAGVLATHDIAVHVFTRKPISISATGVRVHPVGPETSGDLMLGAKDFAVRAGEAFDSIFPGERSDVVLLGHEWTSIPVLTEISSRRRLPSILSLHSLESQRSDMRSELSRAIQQIEAGGLRAAHTTLVHDGTTGTHARKLVPECESKLVFGRLPFISRPVNPDLDAGEVKGRFNVGPIDPTILFIGELDDRHGPDALIKSVPTILKNHKQARFVFVGDGALQWPLRVHARYLLLEHAVRIVGHLSGDPLYDLIQSCDIVCVPSRAKTDDWPVLAAWAAKRPVLATHPTAGNLLKHQVNCLLCYPVENSLVWGIEQLLFNEDLRKKIAEAGHQQLEDLHGWNSVAKQIEALMKALTKTGAAHA